MKRIWKEGRSSSLETSLSLPSLFHSLSFPSIGDTWMRMDGGKDPLPVRGEKEEEEEGRKMMRWRPRKCMDWINIYKLYTSYIPGHCDPHTHDGSVDEGWSCEKEKRSEEGRKVKIFRKRWAAFLVHVSNQCQSLAHPGRKGGRKRSWWSFLQDIKEKEEK